MIGKEKDVLLTFIKVDPRAFLIHDCNLLQMQDGFLKLIIKENFF